MEIPKCVNLAKALEQVNGKIDQQSAIYGGRLIEKFEAEDGFIEKEFDAEQTANYEKASSMLSGKDQKQYARIYHFKLNQQEREDYNIISEYKMREVAIHNSGVHIKTAIKTLEAAAQVRELIESSMSESQKTNEA